MGLRGCKPNCKGALLNYAKAQVWLVHNLAPDSVLLWQEGPPWDCKFGVLDLDTWDLMAGELMVYGVSRGRPRIGSERNQLENIKRQTQDSNPCSLPSNALPLPSEPSVYSFIQTNTKQYNQNKCPKFYLRKKMHAVFKWSNQVMPHYHLLQLSVDLA